MKLRDLLDKIFPVLEKQSEKTKSDCKAKRDAARAEEENLVARLSSDEEIIKEHLTSIESLVEKEDSRRTSVDARLTSIIGLTSIAATVVLTALFAMASGTMPLPVDPSKWVLVLGCCYLTLQLYAALLAAIKGLSRASYDCETASDLLPTTNLAHSVFLRHVISGKLNLLEQHREVNNRKVEQMAVAHRAVENFLLGLLVLAGIAAYIALNRDKPKEIISTNVLMNEHFALLISPASSVSLIPTSGVNVLQNKIQNKSPLKAKQ